jgi:hypothetical protein
MNGAVLPLPHKSVRRHFTFTDHIPMYSLRRPATNRRPENVVPFLLHVFNFYGRNDSFSSFLLSFEELRFTENIYLQTCRFARDSYNINLYLTF